MLHVYGMKGCPHCHEALKWLNERKVPYVYLEVEDQPEPIIKKLIEINGGDDWVVPTLEFNGRWIPGEVFDPCVFEDNLINICAYTNRR
ncbi:MAG: glutaredoxin domain-containing protein [Victivallaceae bacterium]|nr:glutaredoxin domain-containing protein [Victivallaceae bacterium]